MTEKNPLSIGFIGLGSLGEGLCHSLVKGGFPVTLTDLNKDSAKRLLAAGASWSDDVAGACREADVVITVLPSPAISRWAPCSRREKPWHCGRNSRGHRSYRRDD